MKLSRKTLTSAVVFTVVLAGSAQPIPPVIVTQPTNQVRDLDSSARFSVTAIGSGPMVYQWRFQDADLLGKTNKDLDLARIQFTNAGPYSVVLTNMLGSVTSQTVWLSVLPTNVVQVAGRELRFGNLSAPVWESTRIDDGAQTISGNGLMLLYTSSAPGGSGSWDLWMVTRSSLSSPWGAPVNLGPTINSSAVDADPVLSPDGLSLYFDSNRSGGQGGYDLYATTRTSLNTPFGPPVNLRLAINSKSDDATAQVSADNRTMFFASDRLGGLGRLDVWMSTRPSTDAVWGPALHLAPPFNTSSFDFPVALSRDGLLLFIKSDRPITQGDRVGALYATGRSSVDQSFGPLALVRPVLATGPAGVDYCSLSDDGRTLYVGTYRTLYPDWPQTRQMTVTPLPQLTSLQGSGLGELQIDLLGRNGANYEIQTSLDLATWSPWVMTNTLSSTNSRVRLSDPAPGLNNHRFYRALSH